MNDLDEISCKVGIALRSLRLEAGYKSYEQFAFEHGISRIQYWKMESGNNFTLKSLLMVLDAHELRLEKFLLSLKNQKNEETPSSIRLKKILTHLDISKAELAQQLGLKNQNNLNHVLLGRKSFSLGLANKIVMHYPQFNINWILKGQGKFLNSLN